MSIKYKNKDHLKEHGRVELVLPSIKPARDDPLRFWTTHPTDPFLFDLRVFADGQTDSKSPTWKGEVSGRPQLIRELAPAIHAQYALLTSATCRNCVFALRAWWRVFDSYEAKPRLDGIKKPPKVESVRNLNALHEATAHLSGMGDSHFRIFVNLANNVRLLCKPSLRALEWEISKRNDPNRQLIPDDQAQALRIAIKQDWERVRKTWKRKDAIRTGKNLQEIQEPLEEIERLQRNWQHFERIRRASGQILPSTEQLLDANTKSSLRHKGFRISLMRPLAFPTHDEADIAFHCTLMGSGWNPSTLIGGLDASRPDRIFDHPKDSAQSVLWLENEDEDMEGMTMRGSKARAGGRMQFCMGLKKNPASPPSIVAAYLERTAMLREQLRLSCEEAIAELKRLRDSGVTSEEYDTQFEHVRNLQAGLRNVWLYVDINGQINWITGKAWKRYKHQERRVSYLDLVTERLNAKRTARGETTIPTVVPSDFRDIYARMLMKQSGGSILAVMLGLGHASLRSTDNYLDNNIYAAEADETVRRFMTHLVEEIRNGRIDLTILAQIVRHGQLTPEMQGRLAEYRSLMKSRIGVGCAQPKNPPSHIEPNHVEGKWCGTHRCLRDCPNARFLPESLESIAMCVEELTFLSDHLPLETWMRGSFQEELEAGEWVLAVLFPLETVAKARTYWREEIASGKHMVSGVGLFVKQEAK